MIARWRLLRGVRGMVWRLVKGCVVVFWGEIDEEGVLGRCDGGVWGGVMEGCWRGKMKRC